MKKNYIPWVDFIKVFAAFSVVFLHSASSLLYKFNELSARDWWAGNIYDATVRMSVPLFFIISGYLLLGKEETIKDFFVKRINKILVPFIVWSVFYILWKRYFEGGEAISFHSFYSLLLSPSYGHLWFLYALIGLYLYIPILRILIRYSSKEILYYYIALWFIAVSIIPFIERATHIYSYYNLLMISGFVGYLVIGHFLGNIQINKQWIVPALLIVFLCVAITATGTFILTSRKSGVLDEYFYGYLSPNVILLSVSTFVLLKYLSEKIITTENQKTILIALSSASFGIYFIHPAVISILSSGSLGFSLSVFSANAIYSVPLVTILTFGISFIIILFLQKIPFIKKCVP